MTNELSKQICEICGIKPAYKCTYTGDLCPYKYEGNLKLRCPKQSIPEECEVRRKIDYIDFSKPTNFVKLLKIVSQKVDVIFSVRNGNFECAIYAGFFTEESFENNFLNALVRIIKNDPITYGCNYFTQESIKQSIREAEWKYE